VGQRQGNSQLYRVAASGGQEERLTFKGGYERRPGIFARRQVDLFQFQPRRRLGHLAIPAHGAGPDDAKAERVTSDEFEDWFPHISPNGKWMLVFAFPKGTENHNGKMEGVVLRIMPTPEKH